MFLHPQESVPPIMSISMGSLGFLTPFSYDSYTTDIKRVLKGKSNSSVFQPVEFISAWYF